MTDDNDGLIVVHNLLTIHSGAAGNWLNQLGISSPGVHRARALAVGTPASFWSTLVQPSAWEPGGVGPFPA